MFSLLQLRAYGYFLVSCTTFCFKNARIAKITTSEEIHTTNTRIFLLFIEEIESYRFSQIIFDGSGASKHSSGMSSNDIADVVPGFSIGSPFSLVFIYSKSPTFSYSFSF